MKVASPGLCFCCILLAVATAFSTDKKPAAREQYANLHFVVVKDFNDKPIRNASVVLHPVNKDGSQSKGGYQLKTDNEGKTETEGIPYGPLRIQVLVSGFQTFGDDYDINQPDMVITIRMKRPAEQFSSYDKPKAQPTPPSTPPPDNQPHL